MKLLIPGIKFLPKCLESQINVLHRLDRHAVVKVGLYSATNHDEGGTLLRHLLEEGLDPGVRFRGIELVESIVDD